MANNFWESDAVPVSAAPAQTAQASSGDFWEHDAVPLQTPHDPGVLESLARGAAQGASLGFADEITGGVEALKDKLEGQDGTLGELYQRERDDSRANYDAAHAAHPWAYNTGNVAGGVATAVATGGLTGTGLAGAALSGAALGAVSGVGNSTSESTGDLARDALVGGATGGVLGGVGYGAGQVLSKASGPLADAADFFSAKAQGFTKAMRNKFGNDVAAQVGRQGLDQGIVTPLASTADMIARNNALQAQSGQTIGEMYSTLDNVAPGNFSASDLAQSLDDKILAPLRGQQTSAAAVKYLEKVRNDIAGMGEGSEGSFQTAQQVKQFLTDQINRSGGFNPLAPSEKNLLLRQAYKQVVGDIDSAVDSAAEASGQPGMLEDFQANRKTDGNTKITEQTLDNQLSSEAGNKTFGLTDTVTGVVTAAAAHNPLLGVGVVAAKKFGEAYGAQTAAAAANKLSQIVLNSPQVLGQFAPALQRALQSGGEQSLAVTHYLMSQQSPEYREMLRNFNGNGDGQQ